MINLISKDGKKVTHNGKSMKIHTALVNIYETQNINMVTINNRLVAFSNTSWTYVDEIPEEVKDKVMDRYYQDAERMFFNGNIIQA
jgi:hypothetical protein